MCWLFSIFKPVFCKTELVYSIILALTDWFLIVENCSGYCDNANRSDFRLKGSCYSVTGNGYRPTGNGCRLTGYGFSVRGNGCCLTGNGYSATENSCRLTGNGFRVTGNSCRLTGNGYSATGNSYRLTGNFVCLIRLLLLWRHVLLKILTGFGNTAFIAFGVAGNANIAAV